MMKNILALGAILSLLSTPALAAATITLDPGADRSVTKAYMGDTYEPAPVQDLNRLAGDEEDVAKDKDALARDREGYRWWQLNDDKRHLDEDQAKLRDDYNAYANDAHDGAPEDLGGLRSPE